MKYLSGLMCSLSQVLFNKFSDIKLQIRQEKLEHTIYCDIYFVSEFLSRKQFSWIHTYFEKDWVLSIFGGEEFILGKQIQIHIHLNSTMPCEQILSNDNFTLFLLKPSYFLISMLLRNSHVWADSFLSEIQQEEHLIQLEIKFSTHFREADCLRVSMVTAYFLGLKGRHFSSDRKSKIKIKTKQCSVSL